MSPPQTDQNLLKIEKLVASIEKYRKATETDPKDDSAFYNLGNVLSDLAKIKQDEQLFQDSFLKYAEAVKINPQKDNAFSNWGLALYDLAKIKQDEQLFQDSFKKYAEAVKINPQYDGAFYNWGLALYDLATIKQDEQLFRDSFEKYAEAVKINPQKDSAFNNWGTALSDLAKIKQDEQLFQDSFEKYAEAIKINPQDDSAFYNWGIALSDLAKIKQDEQMFLDSFEKYAEAVKINPKYDSAFYNWGLALYNLAKIQQSDLFFKELAVFEKATEQISYTDLLLTKGELYLILNQNKKATECFLKSQNDIIEIIVFLDEENRNKIINTEVEILYPLLDEALNSDDACAFKEATKNIPKDKLDPYKKAYIYSVFVISLLHITNENEKSLAYYTKKIVSQKMLFEEKLEPRSKFRLNSINYSNDPTEGRTLLEYLFEQNYQVTERLDTSYRAFAGCFTFNHDSLNQFRLYGKENDQEGTGVSLVFKDSFFSKEAKMALKQTTDRDISLKEEEQQALFRCIYIDPKTRRVETVGHKESYLFHRENNEEKIEKYEAYIKGVIDNVRDAMRHLQDLVKDLEPAVVGQLLINLRYLTKHIAFKEEQECRIVKIHNLNDQTKVITEGFKQMYVEYLNIPKHIDKIYFGTKANGMDFFQDMLIREGFNIVCKKSENPLT